MEAPATLRFYGSPETPPAIFIRFCSTCPNFKHNGCCRSFVRYSHPVVYRRSGDDIEFVALPSFARNVASCISRYAANPLHRREFCVCTSDINYPLYLCELHDENEG